MNRPTRTATRRQFNGRLLALGITGAAAVAAPPARAQGSQEVVMATFGGTIEQFVRSEIVPAFEKSSGLKLRLVIGTALTNYAKVQASRSRPEIDVYWSNELTHAAGKQQGLYEKIDPKIVTHLPDIIEIARDPDGIGTGVYVLATGLHYNARAYREAGIPAPSSWNDLFDPRLKGRVALYSFDVAYSQDLLVILTRLAGGTEKDVRPGLERLKQLRASGNLAFFATSPAELDNMVVQGQAWLTVNGSPRAFILKDRGAPVDFAFPKEGAGYFSNYFEVIRNAPNPRAAQQLVNFLSSPEIQLVIARGVVAAPVNRKVQIPDSLRGKVPLGEDLQRMIRIDRHDRQLDQWAELWRREVEAKRA
jgi:putative spermidine/putrescine transport system substrate-binding protein